MKKIKIITDVIKARNSRRSSEEYVIARLKARLLTMIKAEMQAQDVSCFTLSKMGRFSIDTVKKVVNEDGTGTRLDIYLRMALSLGIRPRLEFFDDNFTFKVRLDDTRNDV